jgi:hypothetical protein
MLTLAGLLVIAAPLGLPIHLATTSEMTGAEKRMWLCELVGRRGPALFAAYFDTTDRARATHMLMLLHRGCP